MRRSDVAVGVRDRARRRHSRGALSAAFRQPHGVGHLARTGAIEARNPADNVAYEGCHRNHRGRLLVVFFDVRRMPSSCLREATAARMRRSEFAGGVRLRSRCRYRGAVLSVHLRELQRVVHRMHTEACGRRWSRSRRRRSGRPGSLPSRGSHGSGRAEFPHPALRGTVFATRHGRTHGDGSGYRCSNRRIAVGGSPRCERWRSQCHHAQTTRYKKSQARRRLPLRA